MQKNNETIDNLTRIGNSLHLQQNYLSYIKSHQNTQLIMIDVENFKQIDTKEEFEYINQKLDKNILVTGNYYGKGKTLKLK